ncbi:ArnT family glycosyltransferase [Luteibaculum oceani]|uniref:Glycosyltransferase family 39 protein n=1 Tax=Luteibaculum oceani TaxID=1294296 RepID=A0A5C6VK01_9FLAO|nr:glycosyltransferase family 39 protein [Luteibaculum oceani]TXC85370.1 glycosyltransferase family 39 protein [Luteibaculum oceani]
MWENIKSHRLAYFLILLSLLISIFLALTVELGNDEVYYVLYIKYPALSYFDHPGVLGWLGWIFTLGGTIITDFTVRLGPIIFSVLNQIIIYRWLLRRNGTSSAVNGLLIFNASLYLFLIAGVFLLPDSFQLSFWLLSLLFWEKAENTGSTTPTVLGGVLGALALATKYHAVCLPAGLLLYYLVHNRKRIISTQFILYCFLFSLGLIPTILWNSMNDWASFSFHGDRVGFLENGINLNSLGAFFAGQLLYYNPIIILVLFLTLFNRGNKTKAAWLLYSGLALFLISTVLALSKTTLPHWTGPAFIGITVWLALNMREKKRKLLFAGLIFNAAILLGGWYITNYGSNLGSKKGDKLGKNDPTQDLFGWRQLGANYQLWLAENPEFSKTSLLSLNWFPAGHIEHYVRPKNQPLICVGPRKNTHEFVRLNQRFNSPENSNQYLFFHQSNGFHDRLEKLPNRYVPVKKLIRFPIYRSGKKIRYHDLYLIEYQEDILSSY